MWLMMIIMMMMTAGAGYVKKLKLKIVKKKISIEGGVAVGLRPNQTRKGI